MSARTLPMVAVLAVAATVAACQGVVDPIGSKRDAKVIVYFDTGGPRDSDPVVDVTPPTPDSGLLIDAASNPGDPCPTGSCGGNAICVAAICRAKCTQAPGGCNDKTGECPAGEACFSATTFTDACFSAAAKTGETCGSGNNCVEGNVCVQVQGAPPRCLLLCKYGCSPGQTCGKTSNNCSVCI